jgi:hypothetical protein
MGEAGEPRSGCPIDATIEMCGDRWSLFVLHDIIFGDRRYFRELQSINAFYSSILTAVVWLIVFLTQRDHDDRLSRGPEIAEQGMGPCCVTPLRSD